MLRKIDNMRRTLMSAKIIDGKAMSDAFKDMIALRVGVLAD